MKRGKRNLRASASRALDVKALRARLFGGYSPVRRMWRRFRPVWLWRLSRGGATIGPFVARYGLTVRSGPFEGMVYPDRAIGHASTLPAKLMGAYESELSEVLTELVGAGFVRIVNIGAGDGYYAVGLARRIPEATVDAYETDRGDRELCLLTATANGVGHRVSVRGTCDLAALRQSVVGRSLIICDCEGCERDLLRPDRVPELRDATVLVELHPSVDREIPDLMIDRFKETHEIRPLEGTPRDASDWPEVRDLRLADATWLLAEIAVDDQGEPVGKKQWALMSPRNRQTLIAP